MSSSVLELPPVPIPLGCLGQQTTVLPPPVTPYCALPRFQTPSPNGLSVDATAILQACCVSSPATTYGNESGPCWAYCPVYQSNEQEAFTCLQGAFTRGVNFWGCSSDFQKSSPGKSKTPTSGAVQQLRINTAGWVLMLPLLSVMWLWIVF